MALLADYTTGTVSVSASGTVVTGVGTAWATADFREGDWFIAGGWVNVVASVDSETQLTLAQPWAGEALEDAAYRLRYMSDGSRASAQARQLIDLLGGSGNIEALGGLAGAAGMVPVFTGAGTMEVRAYAAGLVPRGVWVDDTEYSVGEVVIHGDFVYASVVNGNIGNEPPSDDTSDEYWMYVPVAPGPEGPKGPVGPANTLEIGTVTGGDTASATITGTAPSQTLNLVLPKGDEGDPGSAGWTPVFAVVADGARYVQQVVDWAGGTGAKPTTGQYVGPSGFVSSIGDAVNIRGASGSGTGDVVGPASAIDGEMVIFDGVTGKLVKGGGPPPTSNINLLKDAGRFAGSPEPQTATATGFVAPSYILPANGATVSAGPKYIYNNNNYGGNAGNLDPDVDALISKLKDASYRRYGVEFYLMQITAGAGTSTARTINGVPHYVTFSIPQLPLPVELTINCHVLVKSGSLGCGIPSDPNWLYLDGERYTEPQQILPADGWRQVTRRVAYEPRQFVGYNNLVPQFFTTPGTVFYVAAFTVAPGIIPISPGKYYGVVPSLEAWRGPPTDSAHGDLGGGSLHAVATSAVAGFMSSTDKTKLNGIAAGATANQSDAYLLDRANHTGKMPVSGLTVTGSASFVLGRTATSGDAGQVAMDQSASANSVARRGAGGVLKVGEPVADDDAATKEYADTKVTKANDTGLGGFTATSKNLGNLGSAITIAPTNGNIQHGTNNAAVTITAPSAAGVYTIIIEIVNSATAGAVTLAGFTKTDGDAFTTTNGDKFHVHIAKTNSAVTATVKALQ